MAYLFLFFRNLSNIDSNEKFKCPKELEMSSACIKDICQQKHIRIWMSITSDSTPTLLENMWRRRIICLETAEFYKCFDKITNLLTSLKNGKIEKIKYIDADSFEFLGDIFHCFCGLSFLVDLLMNIEII